MASAAIQRRRSGPSVAPSGRRWEVYDGHSEGALNYLDQEVAIDTDSSFGADVPLAISSPLLRRLEDTARPCVRMAVEGIRGVLEASDPELLQKHFGKEITIFGKAIYRPSGSLLRLDAEEIVDTTEGRLAFSSIPEVLSKPFRTERRLQTGKTGVAAFFATWPGEETDDDLLTALRELRH